MTAYAVAHLRTPVVNEDVLKYIGTVQTTLPPYGGRFLVHGGQVEVLEGTWPGSIVILEFPDAAAIRAWYASPAYQEILPLRLNHIDSDVIIVEGVPPQYDAALTAARLREQAATATATA